MLNKDGSMTDIISFLIAESPELGEILNTCGNIVKPYVLNNAGVSLRWLTRSLHPEPAPPM